MSIDYENFDTVTWFTSTPVSFGGGSDFFCRDSGLVCKGLQSIGLPCKSIMPLPEHPEDIKSDLIRTDIRDLSDPDWWRSINAHKVVLYSWAHFKYWHIAEALRDSGAQVLINLDGGGIMSPTLLPSLYYHAVISKYIRLHGYFGGCISGLLRSAFYRIYIPYFQEPGRIRHLRAATAIGCVTPGSLALWRMWARANSPDLVDRMHLVPNPVSDELRYNNTILKLDSVIAVGRWNDIETKRPALLAAIIMAAATIRPTTHFHIFGNPGAILSSWHRHLSNDFSKRIHIHGQVPHSEIIDCFKQSRVCLCSSSHEGSHVSSEEALCAGASIVAPARPELNAMHWYISHDSGRLAVDDSVCGISEALLLELEAWDRGERDPISISSHWSSLLLASSVANTVKCLLS